MMKSNGAKEVLENPSFPAANEGDKYEKQKAQDFSDDFKEQKGHVDSSEKDKKDFNSALFHILEAHENCLYGN